MDFDPEQLARLKELGLPEYARRAYLSLLLLGTTEARAVSELARIPPAKVYPTLDALKERGLVEVTPVKPRKYTAVPMDEYFDHQLQERQERLESFRARREEFVALFSVRERVEAPSKARMISVAGRRNVLQRLREGCALAQDEIRVRAPPDLLHERTALAKLLDQARARGVRVRVSHAAPAATAPPERVVFATFDERMAVLAQLVPAAGTADGHETALSTTEPGFVAELRALLAPPEAAGPRAHDGIEASAGLPSAW